MMGRLRRLRRLIEGVAGELECNALLHEIDDDLASEGLISALITAPDAAAGGSLKATLSSAFPMLRVTSHPYLSQREWSESTLCSIRRADALIAETSARRFLPAILFRMLDAAASNNVPTLLMVTGMGKMRDPQSVSEALTAELHRTSLRPVPRIAFIGDERFQGENPEAVLSDFAAPACLDSTGTEAARDGRLSKRHRVAALALAEERLAGLRATEREMGARQVEKDELELSLRATGEALTTFWRNAVLEMTALVWTPHEERAVSVLAGDPHTALATVHSSWFRSFVREFEARIRRWTGSVAYHLKTGAGTLPDLARPLCRIVERAAERMRAVIEEAETTIEKARGKRDSHARFQQASRNTIHVAADSGDPAASGDVPPATDSPSPDGVQASAPDGHLSELLSEVGLATNQILNRMAKSRMKGVLLELAQDLRNIGDRAAADLDDEIARWVATCLKNSEGASGLTPFDQDETRRQMARLIACISELRKPQ